MLTVEEEKTKAILEMKQENEELEHDVIMWKRASENNSFKAFLLQEENEKLESKLEYAKKLLKDLLENKNEYTKTLCEDFIKGKKL